MKLTTVIIVSMTTMFSMAAFGQIRLQVPTSQPVYKATADQKPKITYGCIAKDGSFSVNGPIASGGTEANNAEYCNKRGLKGAIKVDNNDGCGPGAYKCTEKQAHTISQ